uniref:EMAP like 2 n=1 Tax=Pelusios castaneus TaxID=367368 RepID=A0A8C8SV47_9SAUR
MRRAAAGASPSKPKEATFSAEDGYVKMFLRGRPVPMHVPHALVATYSLDTKLELPPKKLKLDWVYGYRGRDCRANLFLLPTGEIVYFVAAVAVLYSVEEQRQRHYLGHNDDIKCLAVHPDMVTMATGQVAGTSKDGKPLLPHVRIWDSVSLNTLHVLGLGAFDRAVSCLGFSKSNGGGLLCAVDDSNEHVLSVWDWQKEQKIADVKCSNESVLAATFHPTEPALLVTCGKSHIYFWTLDKGSLSKRQGIFEFILGSGFNPSICHQNLGLDKPPEGPQSMSAASTSPPEQRLQIDQPPTAPRIAHVSQIQSVKTQERLLDPFIQSQQHPGLRLKFPWILTPLQSQPDCISHQAKDQDKG